MKKLLALLCLAAFICVFCLPVDAQVLWRSAKCMKKGNFIAMGEWYYKSLTKIYVNDKWEDYDDSKVDWGFETMFGYAPIDRWEVMLHVPFKFRSYSNGADESNAGLGDIYFKTRYGILPWAKDKHGLALVASLRLPTGKDDDSFSWNNIGDGTTDIGLAGIFSTAWMNKFRGHLKVNYWINGENSDTKVKPGNEIKFIAKLDRNFQKKLMGFATYIYCGQGEKEVDGTAVTNSDKTRHYLCLGCVYKPKKGVFFRPKLTLPLGGENGQNYTVLPKVDFWYVFQLIK